MASTNLDSADLKGAVYGGLINEDVMQKIWDISKIPLPLQDRIGSDTCKNEYKEWVVDTLAAPILTEVAIDGEDLVAKTNNTVLGTRVGNHCQINYKVVRISTRAQESDTIGNAGTLAYQVMRRQQELRRNVEAAMLSNQASVEDNGSNAAGKSGGLGAWLTSNDYRGAGGSAAGFGSGIVAAPVAGTARALSEKLIRDCVQSVYQNGGDPSVLMSVPSVIRGLSEFLFTSSARIATLTSDQGKSSEKATALGSVNVFVTDFGTLEMVDNRLQLLNDLATDTADVFIIDPQYLSLGLLHGARTEPLAKSGLSDIRQMVIDWTLIVNTEKAHGVIADIDPTLAVTA